MEYVLREFRLGDYRDAELLAAMWNASDQAWPGGWTRGIPETAERILERTQRADRLAIFVAEVKGEIVGYADIAPERGRDDVVEFHLLNVRPDFHGKGLGKALTLKVLERAMELGYKQVTLGTWAGNEKAVLLYKKTGFFWVPETTVWMQNYIPTVLAMPIARPFFQKRDWYRCFKRDLTIAPDEIEWNGIKVYPYHFEENGDRLTVWIDKQAEAPTAVETNDIYVACIIGKEEVVCGLEQTVRWEIVNKKQERMNGENGSVGASGQGSVKVMLMAEGEEGIGLSGVESFEVEDRTVIEKTFTISPDIKPKEPGMPTHQIKSTLLVDGVPVTLGTAVKPVQPVELQLCGQGVVVGKPDEKVVIRLKSNLDFPVKGKLLIDPHPSLRFDKLSAPFSLEPKSWTSCNFYLCVNEVGVFQTRIKAIMTPANSLSHHLTTRPKLVTFRTIPFDSVFAWVDEEEKVVVIETPTLWVLVRLRGGSMTVHERLSGRQSCSLDPPELGPPFIRWRRVEPTYAYRLEQKDGKVSLTIVMPSENAPGVTVERTVTVGAGNFIRIDHRIINTTNAVQKFKLRCGGWRQLRGSITLPLKDGLLHEPLEGWGNFPLWGGYDLSKKPEDYAESWIAFEESGFVVGLVFGDCEEREETTLQFDLPEIQPQSYYDVEPSYIVAGRGNWEVVRQLWSWLKQPTTVREERKPISHPVLSAGFEPKPLLITQPETKAKLVVRNRRGKALNGRWQMVDGKWQIEPNAGELADVRRDSPFEREVNVIVPDLTPLVEMATVMVTDEITTHEFVAPIIILGDARQSVKHETRKTKPETLAVDNGFLSLIVAPAFLGSVIALERGGVNYLNSAYPQARSHSWFNQWFGGIHPFVGWMDIQWFVKEKFKGEPIERIGKQGFAWRGVKVTSDLQHKNHRWLRMELDYLTVGGSNIIAIVQRLINKTDALQWIQSSVCVWLAVGGTVSDNVLYYEQDRSRYEQAASTDETVRVLRHRRRGQYSADVRCGKWAAVENPQTGDVLSLIPSHPNSYLEAWDEGKDGVAFQTTVSVSLEPNEKKEMVTWLALCRSVAEAQAYRALGEVWELP